MIHYSEELKELLERAKSIEEQARLNRSQLSAERIDDNDTFIGSSNEWPINYTEDPEKIRERVLNDVLARGLRTIPEEARPKIQTLPRGISPLDNGIRTTGLPNGDMEVTIDKRKWKMSVPREKENEQEVTIIFNRKESDKTKVSK